MALTAHPLAPPATSAPAPRHHPSDTSAEPWRDAITDYLPPAGPDGCWASSGRAVPEQDAARGRS